MSWQVNYVEQTSVISLHSVDIIHVPDLTLKH